jgi:hypothetical protein
MGLPDNVFSSNKTNKNYNRPVFFMFRNASTRCKDLTGSVLTGTAVLATIMPADDAAFYELAASSRDRKGERIPDSSIVRVSSLGGTPEYFFVAEAAAAAAAAKSDPKSDAKTDPKSGIKAGAKHGGDSENGGSDSEEGGSDSKEERSSSTSSSSGADTFEHEVQYNSGIDKRYSFRGKVIRLRSSTFKLVRVGTQDTLKTRRNLNSS